MNWLNLNVQTLDSEEFLGSDPIDRATWLCLQRYCIGQENGGSIEACKDWSDRKWQQLVRITKKEADRKCDLWSWCGNTLIVWGYPSEKETEVRQKRDTAKTNGAKGGRPKKTDIITDEKPTLVNSAKAEGERKGKERKGMEGEEEIAPPPSPKFEEVERFAKSQMFPIPEECTAAFFDEMEALQWTYKGMPCVDTRAWQARFRKWATNWHNNSSRPNGRSVP